MRGWPAALALCAVVAVAAGAVTMEEWRVERRQWRRDLAGVATVHLTNPWGEVRVRDEEGHEMFVVAAVQHHRDDPRGMDVEFTERGADLDVTVRFLDGEEVDEGPDWHLRRVDVALYVPPALNVDVRTQDGLIEVRGVDGDATLETASGDIKVRARGRLLARSELGRILVHFLRTDWPQPSSLETVDGEIRVEMPRGGNAAVEVETRGEITSDYSIDIQRAAGSLLKRGTARVGDGGQLLRLKSQRGLVKLLASLVPELGPEAESAEAEPESHPAPPGP